MKPGALESRGPLFCASFSSGLLARPPRPLQEDEAREAAAAGQPPPTPAAATPRAASASVAAGAPGPVAGEASLAAAPAGAATVGGKAGATRRGSLLPAVHPENPFAEQSFDPAIMARGSHHSPSRVTSLRRTRGVPAHSRSSQ